MFLGSKDKTVVNIYTSEIADHEQDKDERDSLNFTYLHHNNHSINLKGGRVGKETLRIATIPGQLYINN